MRSDPELFPSAPQAALLLLASFLLQYLVAVALFDFRRTLNLSTNQMDALVMLLSNGFLLVTVMHFREMTYRNLLHPAKASVTATVLLVVPPVMLLVPLLLLAGEALNVLVVNVLPLSRWEEQVFSRMVAGNLAAIVATCVLAPVLEEMLFRGVILRSFLGQYEKGNAIATSAFFFGLAHLNIYQFVLAFALGLLLGWLFERSRSLIPCIALHATYNSLVVANELVSGAEHSLSDKSLLTWAAGVGAALIGLIALRYLFGDFAGRRRQNTV